MKYKPSILFINEANHMVDEDQLIQVNQYVIEQDWVQDKGLKSHNSTYIRENVKYNWICDREPEDMSTLCLEVDHWAHCMPDTAV